MNIIHKSILLISVSMLSSGTAFGQGAGAGPDYNRQAYKDAHRDHIVQRIKDNDKPLLRDRTLTIIGGARFLGRRWSGGERLTLRCREPLDFKTIKGRSYVECPKTPKNPFGTEAQFRKKK